jgi:hypothetical protein
LTQRELLSLHAEVKAMQGRLGISYKDATHRLYMAEIEKLALHSSSMKANTILKNRLVDGIKSLETKLLAIGRLGGRIDVKADANTLPNH